MIAFDLAFFLAVATVMLAGLVRGFSGFGAALVMAPALSLLYGPVVAVPSVVLLDMVAVLQLLPVAVRHADWRSVAPMAAAAALTIPLGAWLLVSIEAEVMRRAIAIVVLGFVALLATGWRYAGRARLVSSLAAGSVSGLTGGATSMGGPPVIVFYLASPLTAVVARASIIGFFTLTTTVQIGTYALHGVVTTEVILRCLILAPPYIAATWLGSRLFGKAPERLFRRAAFTILVVIALIALIA